MRSRLWLSWLLLSCVHTPPHPAPTGTWHKDYVYREQMTFEGVYCVWEAESLSYDTTPLWTATPPEREDWCKEAGEWARYFDVFSQDGSFLSVQQHELSCCPDQRTVQCVTWNLETGQPATLSDYDDRYAEARWRRAQAKHARTETPGTLSADSFLVDNGHVLFCAVDQDQIWLIPIR